MNYSVFAYPGNKSSLADWVVSHLPQHKCYVEPFGGGAGVLANKPESYNDIDADLVQFFDVLRERGAVRGRAIRNSERSPLRRTVVKNEPTDKDGLRARS